MNRKTYNKILLNMAGTWNMAIAVILLSLSLLDPPPFDLFGAETPISMVFFHTVVFFVFLFGIAFFIASRDVKRNIAVIFLGFLEKVMMFTINFIYYLIGDVGIPVLFMIIVDLAFGILFLELLVNAKKKTGTE
ncbi:MAG: hypothetical protein ACFFCS_10645 [Candidatus Hodarchaeota archaeon]